MEARALWNHVGAADCVVGCMLYAGFGWMFGGTWVGLSLDSGTLGIDADNGRARRQVAQLVYRG
jgi:hypothetical protein